MECHFSKILFLILDTFSCSSPFMRCHNQWFTTLVICYIFGICVFPYQPFRESLYLGGGNMPNTDSPLLHLEQPQSFIWSFRCYHALAPQWDTAGAEIKDPSIENLELKGFSFETWSRSVYIPMHASPGARDLFCANFNPSSPFTSIFS